MHSECRVEKATELQDVKKIEPQNSAPRAVSIGIQKARQPFQQATGERVGDEKIAERRVATKARKPHQRSPRVFSEIFCSAHPERVASQPS